MATKAWAFIGMLTLAGSASATDPTYSWRYFRPGNTGIQGDYCDALWIGPDNDPWIGGYDPGFEEGGLAKFVQSENRWVNISNVDYPEIGHPENTGTTRVRDITPDAQGNLWMGTGRGVLKFNPTIGPGSLKHYTTANSPWPGGWVTNIEIAPDGTIWASGYATVWGGGGLMRFNPATNTWTYLGSSRPENLAIQPKSSGGYYVWAADGPSSIGLTQRYDSTTQAWTTIPGTSGNPRNLPGNKCVDTSGNMWIYRVLPDNFNAVLDCRRPDGTWVGVPQPPGGGGDVLRVTGPNQSLAISNGQVRRYNGASWLSLGDWGNVGWTYDLAMDSKGAVWASGVGGAAKRDPSTGAWQRYRITNTSQFDCFNNDLSIDPVNGAVYACANAGPGAGGMVKFDGVRWTGWNQLTYGLGHDWPFPTDNSQAICVRPSNGNVVINPMFNGTKSYNGSVWSNISGGSSDVVAYTEDSLGRLWGLGEYFSLGIYQNGGFANYQIAAWGQSMRPDLDRPGTVWANAGYEVTRTDGAYRFSRTVDSFPELTSQSDTFWGMAPGRNGVVWLGCSVMLGAGGSGGGLIRLDANTGAYTMMKFEDGWTLPGAYVTPLLTSPDGRVWMVYVSTYQYFDGGLCWYDPATGQVGTFPGPIDGAPQWGGLPHTQIKDMEVREIPGGYELWMSCLSRGIAVLTVTYPSCPADFNHDGFVNGDDYDAFAVLFDAADPGADFNHDGFVNGNDYDDFAGAFDAGC
ncbi:MAG: hypothetical protein U0638_03085 [Phycisphaerales bacterium]